MAYEIINSPPPSTFIFKFHGDSDNFFFEGGKVVISHAELTQILLSRVKRWPILALGDPSQTDIIISESCQAYDPLRKVLCSSYSEKYSPIMIAWNEYAQYGWGSMPTISGNEALDFYLQLGTKGGSTTMRRILEFPDGNKLLSNPSVFIRDGGIEKAQIARNMEKGSEEAATTSPA